MAVNSLFSAVDVADGTLELKHALVQAGVSAVGSFAGGALGTGALSSSLISQGTSTAFSGIDYEEGGGIGWSNDNFTAGVKSGLVNMAITAATHSDNASMWQKAGSSFASSYAGTAFDYSSDGFKIGWNEGAGERALVAGAAGAAATTASHYAGLSDVNAKPAKDFDYSNSFTMGGYLDKMMTNTIESGAMSFYDMARHDLSWSDSSKQNGFYGGMIYQTGDIGGFLGDRASVKVKQNYEEYRDQRAKQQQQERGGLPTDAEDPFNGAEEMLFGLMDGLRRTEESFGNLFSGDGFNTDADLNNMDWETYDGYMKTVENMTAKFQADPEGNFLNETTREEFIEYLQAKMRSGQELNDWEQQCVVDASSQYAVGTIVANFNGDYEHETNSQIAQLDDAGYDTANLKKHVGYMRKVDQYNKMVKAYEQAESQAYNSYKIYGSVDSRDMALLPAVSKINQARVEASNSSPGLWSGQNTVVGNPFDVFTNDHYRTNYTDSPFSSFGKDVGYGLLGGLKSWGNLASNVIGTPITLFDEGLSFFGLTHERRDYLDAMAMSNGFMGIDDLITKSAKGIGLFASIPIFVKNRKVFDAAQKLAKSNVDDALRQLDKAKKNSSLTYVAKSADKVDLSYDISKWKEYGLPGDGYFGKMVPGDDAFDLIKGGKINLAGDHGGGFINMADELTDITTSVRMKEAMAVPYSPDYLLEFQLKNPQGLHNLLQYDDPFFKVGGKTLNGFSEYNFKGLTSDNIINWRLRKLKK